MRDYIIRSARPEDFPGVAELMDRLYHVHSDRRPDLFAAGFQYDREKDFLPLLESREAIALVAEGEGRAVGLCFAQVRDQDGGPRGTWREGYVDDLMVLPQWRSRGIARALMAEAEARAKAMGADRMTLNLWQFNEEARRLYGSLGYEAIWSWLEKPI